MKKILLTTLLSFTALAGLAQQPVIEGDVMLCPESNGTAYVANDVAYDGYQWYVDVYPYDNFVAIEGATESSFTYDAYNYSVSYLKVVATLNGESYDSNVLSIDGWAFGSITYMTETEGDAYFDPNTQNYVICESGGVINTVNPPYSIVQWYKDGAAIEGATSPTFTATEPGTYYAVASPQECPDFQQTTLPQTIVPCSTSDPSPAIAGDVMLCPNTNGIAGITNNMEYDSYQWYADFYPYDEFELIEGATQASFTYDWFTYDQAKLKVVVTVNGETYESNIIQIDSYNWAGMSVSSEDTEQATWNPDTETWMLCEGAGFAQTVNSPYTANIQWYKDGVAIEGATEVTYNITSAGSYTVVASPAMCPQEENSAQSLPIVVVMQDCNMGTDNPQNGINFTLYPNPAKNKLNILLPDDSTLSEFTIFDTTGKRLLNGKLDTHTPEIDVISLEGGTYLLQLKGDKAIASMLFFKL